MKGDFGMERKYWIVFVIAAMVLLFFGNADLMVTDNVESNYALTSKEMVESGDWLSPQIYGRYWYDKPIFFYWLTAFSFKLFGFTEFAARLFPALFGLAGLGLLCYGGCKLYTNRAGFYSGIVLLSSVEFFIISKSIITDAVLFFFFSATLLFFYLAYRDGKRLYWYIMYGAAGFAVLTKGPIGVLLPGLIITLFLLWQRDWRLLGRCHLVSGTIVFLTVAAPWYTAMYFVHGSDFIDMFFGVHNVLRATVSEHPRDDVIYYYTMVNTMALFPWTLLLPWAGWKRFRDRNWKFAPQEGFLLLWVVTIFFFFQNMATKYITYTYPLLFPTALLLGHLLDTYGERCFFRGYKAIQGAIIVILVGAAWWANSIGKMTAENLYILPISLMIGVLLFLALQQSQKRTAIGLAVVCVCFYLGAIASVAIPMTEKNAEKSLATLIEGHANQSIGVYGKYPTSAVFYGQVVPRRMIAEEQIDSYVPRKMSWSSKNVMPYATFEENDVTMVAVREENLQSFLQKDLRNFRVVEQSDSWLLLSAQ